MTLTTTTLPARTKLTGEQGNIVLPAGRVFKIETTPGGAEVLEVTVPAGKVWTVVISVSIDETNV